jgi:hypothetical protein
MTNTTTSATTSVSQRRRLSSPYTRIFKITYIIIGLSIVIGELVTTGGNAIQIMSVLAAGVLIIAIYRVFVTGLIDDVYDCGDCLIFARGRVSETVEVYEIIDIRKSLNLSPSRIVVGVSRDTRFGRRLAFHPCRSINEGVIQELIARARISREQRNSGAV